MTGTHREPSWLERWWEGPVMTARRRRWTERYYRLLTVEYGLATAILFTWTFATIRWAPLVLAFVLGIGLLLQTGAVETGNHVLAWLATGMVMLLMLLGGLTFFAGFEPVPLAVGTMTVVAYNELLRMHQARRRNAAIDDEVFLRSAAGLGVLAATSVIGVVLATTLGGDEGDDRSWLWMAGASAILALGALLLVVVPKRTTAKVASRTWQPGTRIPPQPLGRRDPLDDPRS